MGGLPDIIPSWSWLALISLDPIRATYTALKTKLQGAQLSVQMEELKDIPKSF